HDLVGEDVVALEVGGDRDDLLVRELAHQRDHLALLLGQPLQGDAHAVASPSLMPAATPRATTASAILRDASSIIWPSCMTAPFRSTWVACSYATRSLRASSESLWLGANPSFALPTPSGG